MHMKSRWLAAVGVGLVFVGLSGCTTSNGGPGNPTGTGFMWVATQGDQLINAYSINLSNGATTQVGTAAATGLGPIAMALTPAGDTLFVANRDDNTISAYTVKTDGSLTAAGGPTSTLVVSPTGCTAGCAAVLGQTPLALAVDPTGKFLFVASQGTQVDPTVPGTVSVYSISGTTLTPVGPACPANYSQSVCPVVITVPASTLGTGPSGLAVSPAGSSTGGFLYVTDQFTSTVSILAYDGSGMLTQNPVPPVTVGSNPTGLAFSRCAGTTTVTANCPAAAPPGYLFVANSGSNNISVFSACIQVTTACPSANGTLTAINGSPVGSSGIGPVSFVVDPVLDFVYVINNTSFQVSQYKYSPATGLLSLLPVPTVSTGASPLTGGITADGNWVFVPNNGGSNVSGFSLKTPAGVTSSGELGVGTAVTLVGQPSAVLIR